MAYKQQRLFVLGILKSWKSRLTDSVSGKCLLQVHRWYLQTTSCYWEKVRGALWTSVMVLWGTILAFTPNQLLKDLRPNTFTFKTRFWHVELMQTSSGSRRYLVYVVCQNGYKGQEYGFGKPLFDDKALERWKDPESSQTSSPAIAGILVSWLPTLIEFIQHLSDWWLSILCQPMKMLSVFTE